MRKTALLLAALTASAAAVVAPSATAVDVKGTVNRGVPLAGFQTIGSSGPLSEIGLGEDLSCQVSYGPASARQIFYPDFSPADCGTFLAVGESPSTRTLYAPNFAAHAGTATGSLGAYTPFTSVSQTPPTGSGTLADPYIVTTVVDAGATGLRVTQMDTYVKGQGHFRSDIVVTNHSSGTKRAVLSRGVDCYLAGSDSGVGAAYSYPASQTSTAACVKPNSTRAQRLVAMTAQNTYLEDTYSAVWAAIGAKAPLANFCRCTPLHDNAIAVAWDVSIPPNGSVLRTLRHEFVDGGIVVEGELPDEAATVCAIDADFSGETPRPRVSCALAPPADTVDATCVADGAGGTRVDAAVTCALPVAAFACFVSARPDAPALAPAPPCAVRSASTRTTPLVRR